MQTSGLETFKQFVERNTAANVYPSTEWQLRGLHRNRGAHGLDHAFVKIGSRWLVDRARFYALLGSRSTAA